MPFAVGQILLIHKVNGIGLQTGPCGSCCLPFCCPPGPPVSGLGLAGMFCSLRGCCAPLYQDAAPGPGALSASPFVAHRCRSLFFAGSAIATEPGERVNFCWAFGDSVGLRWRFALRLAPTGHGTDYLLSGARASGCSNSWRTKKRMRSTSRFFPGQAVSFPGTSRCPMMEDGVNPGR